MDRITDVGKFVNTDIAHYGELAMMEQIPSTISLGRTNVLALGGSPMYIHMTASDLASLSKFLNDKYEERRAKAKQQRRRYSMSQFARDVGLKRSTLSRYMSMDEDMALVEALDTPILMALWDHFGAEFMEALRGDATKTLEKREELKRTKGAGG